MSPATAAASGSGASSSSSAAASRPSAAPKGFDPKGRAGSPASSLSAAMSRAMAGLHVVNAQGKLAKAVHPDNLQLARRAPINGAANFGELILLIPGPYREYLVSFLKDAMKSRRQLAGVKGQLSSLIESKRTGKIPSWMNIRPPTMQTVKGFMAENEGAAKPFEAAHLAFQTAVLDRAIEVKRTEVAYLGAHCNLRVEDTSVMDDGSADRWVESPLYKSIIAALTSRFDEIYKEAKVPVWGDPTDDSHGRPVFLGWKADEALSVEYQEVLTDFPHIFNRALQFVDDQILAEELKIEKKRALKDTVMKDVDEHITSSSIQSMVDKKVAVAVKALGTKKGKGKKNPEKKQSSSPGPKAEATGQGKKTKRGKASGAAKKAKKAGKEPAKDQAAGKKGGKGKGKN